MKKLIAILLFLSWLPTYGQPVLRQLLTTNAVQSPTQDGFLLTTISGFPTFTNATFSNVTFTTINVTTNYTTNAFITTNFVSNEFVTNLTVFTNLFVDNITVTSNTFVTINTNVQIKNLVVTNGFSPGFLTLLTPNSQATNWIIDASKATYFTIKATNNINIQYLTNTIQNVGITGAAISLRVLPNGSDRVLTVNSNWVMLQTNIWTIVTSANPGYWQTTVTNAQTAEGPRALLLSAVCFDSAFNQTNTVVNALMSP